MKTNIIFFLLLFSLFSCSDIKPFDEKKALAENKVKSIDKKHFRFENGKRNLILNTISFLDSKGKIITDSTILSNYGVMRSYSVKKYYYSKQHSPDSIQGTWYSQNNISNSVTLFYYSFYELLDSSINIDIIDGKRIRQGFKTAFLYPERDIEIEEVYYDGKLKEKVIFTYDNAGKLIATERTGPDSDNGIVKTFNYQYDQKGKRLSLELDNANEKGIQHSYEYFENDLVKKVSILSQNGDTSYLTIYEYQYRKD